MEARWVSDDPQAFIERLHPNLVPTFLNRVRDSASEEVKAAAAKTFRHWIASLQPENLNDEGIVARLAILVETDPDTYIGRLRELVETAPDEVLRVGTEWGSSPRRQFVWLCERLAAFPAYYSSARQYCTGSVNDPNQRSETTALAFGASSSGYISRAHLFHSWKGSKHLPQANYRGQ